MSSSLMCMLGRQGCDIIIFLNGITRGRHQSHVRKIPWTTFFNGVVHTTNKQTVAPPTEGPYPTAARFSTHKWRDGAPQEVF
jgi:hypothetical protein